MALSVNNTIIAKLRKERNVIKEILWGGLQAFGHCLLRRTLVLKVILFSSSNPVWWLLSRLAGTNTLFYLSKFFKKYFFRYEIFILLWNSKYF